MHIASGRNVIENIIPDPDSESYHTLQIIKDLSETKLKHLQQMYKDFVPRDHCLPLFYYTVMNTTMHSSCINKNYCTVMR